MASLQHVFTILEGKVDVGILCFEISRPSHSVATSLSRE